MLNVANKDYCLMKQVKTVSDLKEMGVNDLPELAGEIREFIIENVSKTGGHIGASLGVVDLTIALHYLFDSPKDKISWDVGHQSYTHKILIGRKEIFHTFIQ